MGFMVSEIIKVAASSPKPPIICSWILQGAGVMLRDTEYACFLSNTPIQLAGDNS